MVANESDLDVGGSVAEPVQPLVMLRLIPDMTALARWAAATGQRALRDDAGYALHAALRATLGDLAPKPFALLQRPGSVQFIGYSSQPALEIQRALDLAMSSDPAAAQALGLAQPAASVIKSLPADWREGERLSFEVRVAPVVRSRSAKGGGYPEVDAAYHPDFCGDAPGDREAAHTRWLARELGRGDAAELLTHRVLSFQLTAMARRAAAQREGRASRDTRSGLLPDLTVRGQLRIKQPLAFQALLARGLGRHRSFGFGCLLLAPPGAWT